MQKLRIILLYPFSLLYGWITFVRNFLFDRQLLRTVAFDTPVISIGNLSTGGTGKTPHVIYLAELLQPLQIAILSRGYGRQGKEFLEVEEGGQPKLYGDEPLMIKQRHPDWRVFVCADRVVGFTWIMHEAPETQVVLLDDAFQHRYIQPALQVLLTTWSQPFCRDFLLPSGNLREARSGANRADLVIVTKCPNNLTYADGKLLEEALASYTRAPVCFSTLSYTVPNHHLSMLPLNPEEKVVLVSGIAHPEEFINQAHKFAKPTFNFTYSDHHAYNIQNLKRILDKMKETGATAMLTTEKDYVKFRNQKELWQLLQNQNIYLLKMKPVFCFGGEDVVKAVLTSILN